MKRISIVGLCAVVLCVLGVSMAMGQVAPAVHAAAAGRAATVITDGQRDQMEAVLQPPAPLSRRDREPVLSSEGFSTDESTAAAAPAFTEGGDRVWRIAPVTGDVSWLPVLGLTASIIERQSGTSSEIESRVEAWRQLALERGYYFSTVKLTGWDEASGTVGLVVDAGRIHSRTITVASDTSTAFRRWMHTLFAWQNGGRTYYSTRQIERRLQDVADGERFNYARLYNQFQALNAHPDLTADVVMRLPEQTDDDQRQVDLDVTVTERMPLHLVMDIDNDGTDATDNWMGRLTLQHLNLTGHDDILSVNIQSALNFGALGGVAASYYLPFQLLNGGSLAVYGGWTDVDDEDVLPYVDVAGHGYFGGVQASFNVVENDRRNAAISAGVVHRYVTDYLRVAGERYPSADLTLRPFSLAATYSDKQPDALAGFNFASFEWIMNFGDFLGTSDQEEISAQRAVADKDYMIWRGQYARLQNLFPFAKGSLGRWMLYLKVSGQYADGPLVPAEQFGIGGWGSVRGYSSREFLGDHGAAGTLELRTPLLLGPFSRAYQKVVNAKWEPKKGVAPVDRLQFVLFGDVGYVKVEDMLEGMDDDQTLYSLGLGLRLAVTDHMQVRFDWGFPLEETYESDHSGSGHLNVQLQF